MNCENFLLLLDAYIEDELELQENSEVSEHLAVCEACAFSYKQIRGEQEIFERYFLDAEATPALWKNLQSAIRNEKIAPPAHSPTLIAGKFKKFFRAVCFGFSPGKTALAGFGVFVLFTFIFLFTGREKSSIEYTERAGEILPISRINEQIELSSPVGGTKTREDVRLNQPLAVAKTAAGRLQISQIRRPSAKEKALPVRNSGITQSKTKTKTDLLPGERKYLETIARLSEEVKAVETNMPPVLSVEYQRNLSTVDQAIAETRSAAQRYPKNSDVANFVLSAYRGKIALLTEVAKQSKSPAPGFK